MAGFGEVPQRNTTEDEKPKNEKPVDEVDTSYLDLVEGGFQKDPAVVAEQEARVAEDNAKADVLEAQIISGEIGNGGGERSLALEKAQPLIDQYIELRRHLDSQQQFNIAQSDYFILAGNKEGFFKVYGEVREASKALGGLYDQALAEYRKAGGEGDLKDIPGMRHASTQQEYVDFEKNAIGSQERQFEARKAALARPQAEKGTGVPGSVEASSPFGYSSALLKDAEQVMQQSPEHLSPQSRKEGLVNFYSMKAQGFGLAALESGDLLPAAQALAIADVVGGIPDGVRERITQAIQKLGESERAKLAELIKREKDTFKPKVLSYIGQV